MLGALIPNWTDRITVSDRRDPLLLTAAQFNREVARERLRSHRRAFPFCVITIDLAPAQRRRRQSKNLVRVLHRNLRMTDQKAFIGGSRYAVLLVDTPEMGGRIVVDRLSEMAAAKG